jgi:hypothetical protein
METLTLSLIHFLVKTAIELTAAAILVYLGYALMKLLAEFKRDKKK